VPGIRLHLGMGEAGSSDNSLGVRSGRHPESEAPRTLSAACGGTQVVVCEIQWGFGGSSSRSWGKPTIVCNECGSVWRLVFAGWGAQLVSADFGHDTKPSADSRQRPNRLLQTSTWISGGASARQSAAPSGSSGIGGCPKILITILGLQRHCNRVFGVLIGF